MTAPALAVMHPSWCEAANCSGGNSPEHRGAYTTWTTADGYAQINLALDRADDGLPDVQLRGETRIRLGICDVESVDAFADAYLGREDARMLITFLQRHLDELDRKQWDRSRSADEPGGAK